MILKPLFSEILRPCQLSDLTLPQPDIDKLEQMVASRAIMNLLFYGKTGSGKTSAARVILSILAPHSSTEIDGSLLTGADYVREHVRAICLLRVPLRTKDLFLGPGRLGA